MFLRSLQLRNFKNYEEADAEFCPHINCLVGLNGSGKTNVLDAIHYLSLTKSHFNSLDAQNIRDQMGYFVINGAIDSKESEHQIHCSLKRNEKKLFKVDGLEYDRLSQHLGKFPIVLIAPDDDELIRGVSELRRKFFDSIISQTDADYLLSLIHYNHQLKQRNALLKSTNSGKRVDPELLLVYDEPLIKLSVALAKKREAFIQEFEPCFESNYARICEEREIVKITYRTKALSTEFEKEFLASREKDLIMQRTHMGIHKDDFQFEIGDKSTKKFGSQGQQKSFLISLKLAQFEFMKKHLGKTPILLLDDIFDKLDDGRIKCLLDIISSDEFEQIFITDAREERTMTLINDRFEPLRIFRIEENEIRAI